MSLVIWVYDHVPLYVLFGMTGEAAFRTAVLYVLYVHDSNVLS